MKNLTNVTLALLLSVVFIADCFAGESAEAADLIKEARAYIADGDKEKAVAALDAAFESANSAGDHAALMQIGDLYVAANPSLEEKAVRAWTTAGRLKCR